MSTQDGAEVGIATSLWGQEVVTIASNVGAGADQDCRSCIVCADAANTGVIKVQKGATADANDAEIPKGVPVYLNISNTSQLNFYGATNGDKISIFWFN